MVNDDEYIPYPGVEDDGEKRTKQRQVKQIDDIERDIEPIEDKRAMTIEEKEQLLQERREGRFDRQREKELDKQLKMVDEEETHPHRVRLRKRVKSARTGAKRIASNAWSSTKQVGHEVKEHRRRRGQYPYGAPKVLARPRGMRMASGPSHRPSPMSEREMVSNTMERDFFGNTQKIPGQEPNYFGEKKTIASTEKQPLSDLIGTSGKNNLQLSDLIGDNTKKKKETKYF